MNHRSAPRLVALQKAMYTTSLNDTNGRVQTSNKWKSDDGTVSLYITNNERMEADAIVKDILEKINLGVLPNDICILCKQKSRNYTQKLITVLVQNNIRARLKAQYQDLIKEAVVEIFIAMLILSLERTRPNE